MPQATLKEWPGIPVREIQLGPEVDIHDPDALSEVMQRCLTESELLKHGELRKVPKASTRTKITGKQSPLQKISMGHTTNYDVWEKLDVSEGEDGNEEFDLIPVSEEERQRESMLEQARTNSVTCREKGLVFTVQHSGPPASF
jgi:hypothetical protein